MRLGPVLSCLEWGEEMQEDGVEGEASSVSICHRPLHQGGPPGEVALAGGMVVESRGTGGGTVALSPALSSDRLQGLCLLGVGRIQGPRLWRLLTS